MLNQVLRQCRSCGLQANNEDDLELFQKSSAATHGRNNFCKACDNARSKTDKAKDPEAWLKRKRDAQFKKMYGFDSDTRQRIIAEHKYCDICGKEFDLDNNRSAHIDHSHSKKHVRGVLCNKCNTGLGKFNDSVSMLNKAMMYLIEREHFIDSSPFGIKQNLDDLYHNGIEGWKESIQAVKDKYPKE